MSELAGDLVSASTTLAALVLVFLGGLFNSLESQGEVAREANLPVYRRRAQATFCAFVLSVISVIVAIIAHATQSTALTLLAAALLVVVLVWLLVAASSLLRGFH